MHFARPEYLNLLWGLPLLAMFFFWSLRRRRRRLQRLVSPELTPLLAADFSRGKAFLRAALLLGFFLFALLAAARPQWGMKTREVRRQGVDLMLALDVSYSMNTEDIAPSRLVRAKSAIRSLVARVRGDRVGLVTFAGNAVVQCPLTLDYGAVSLFLDAAGPETIPEPGTSLAAAIRAATGAFIAEEKKYKVLVIFTDGEDLEGQVDEAVERAREGGVIIYSVGIGSPEGRPIPVRDAAGNIQEYRRDKNGQVVISRLDERSLARIADETGGRYFRSTVGEGELEEIYDEIAGMEKKELEARIHQNFEDRFQYPLAPAIALLAAHCWLTERRRLKKGERD